MTHHANGPAQFPLGPFTPYEQNPILRPQGDGWESSSVYNPAAKLLFDPARPTEILAQMNRPWLEPTTYEDQHGQVSNVTFVEGLVHFGDTWFAYYGQSDSTLGVATYKVGETWSDLGRAELAGASR